MFWKYFSIIKFKYVNEGIYYEIYYYDKYVGTGINIYIVLNESFVLGKVNANAEEISIFSFFIGKVNANLCYPVQESFFYWYKTFKGRIKQYWGN